VGLTAHGLKLRLVFARAVGCAGPRLICHRHGLVAGQDCWILLDWCGVWPELLHWSGFRTDNKQINHSCSRICLASLQHTRVCVSSVISWNVLQQTTEPVIAGAEVCCDSPDGASVVLGSWWDWVASCNCVSRCLPSRWSDVFTSNTYVNKQLAASSQNISAQQGLTSHLSHHRSSWVGTTLRVTTVSQAHTVFTEIKNKTN